MENIFKSNIKLNFVKKEIENDYRDQLNQKILLVIRRITIFLGLLSLFPSIEIFYLLRLTEERDFQAVMSISFFINFIYFILIFLTFMTKHYRTLKIINYINYYALGFIILNFLYPLLNYVKLNRVFVYGIFSLEVIIRIVWIITGIHGFIESVTICVVSSLAVWSVYSTIGKANFYEDNILLLLTRSICMLLVVVFAYFLEKNHKKAFYSDFLNKKKTEWLDNVLNKMNSGFFSVKEDKINYTNSIFKKKYRTCSF